MARKQRFSDSDEVTLDPYSSASDAGRASVEIVDSSAELVNPAPVLASAVERDGAPVAAPVAGPSKYRVERDALVMSHGHRTLLRAGKVIDAHNYDVAALQSQGVVLAAV
jgi:hypothetical protein